MQQVAEQSLKTELATPVQGGGARPRLTPRDGDASVVRCNWSRTAGSGSRPTGRPRLCARWRLACAAPGHSAISRASTQTAIRGLAMPRFLLCGARPSSETCTAHECRHVAVRSRQIRCWTLPRTRETSPLLQHRTCTVSADSSTQKTSVSCLRLRDLRPGLSLPRPTSAKSEIPRCCYAGKLRQARLRLTQRQQQKLPPQLRGLDLLGCRALLASDLLQASRMRVHQYYSPSTTAGCAQS